MENGILTTVYLKIFDQVPKSQSFVTSHKVPYFVFFLSWSLNLFASSFRISVKDLSISVSLQFTCTCTIVTLNMNFTDPGRKSLTGFYFMPTIIFHQGVSLNRINSIVSVFNCQSKH